MLGVVLDICLVLIIYIIFFKFYELDIIIVSLW